MGPCPSSHTLPRAGRCVTIGVGRQVEVIPGLRSYACRMRRSSWRTRRQEQGGVGNMRRALDSSFVSLVELAVASDDPARLATAAAEQGCLVGLVDPAGEALAH